MAEKYQLHDIQHNFNAAQTWPKRSTVRRVKNKWVVGKEDIDYSHSYTRIYEQEREKNQA